MSPAVRNVVAVVALAAVGAASYRYWRMKATSSVDVQAARAALAEDARIVCLPPPHRTGAPGGRPLSEDEVHALLLRLATAPSVHAACAAELAANDAYSPDCDRALAASAGEVDALRASLRSERATFAYAVRAPLADIATDDEGRPAESGPTPHEGFLAFTSAEHVHVARDVRRRGGKEGGAADDVPLLDRCTELAILAHDLWSVGDLTAMAYTKPLVDDVVASCKAARAEATPEARAVFDAAVNAPDPPLADIVRRDFAGVSLLHFGALATDERSCPLATELAAKGAHPTTAPELDALAHDWREATSASAAWRADPEHDPSTKKFVDEYAAMVARLRSATAGE